MMQVDKQIDVDVTTVSSPAGATFKIAIAPSANVEEILDLTLDPDNDVFDVREINVGNEEFTIAMGRSKAV